MAALKEKSGIMRLLEHIVHWAEDEIFHWLNEGLDFWAAPDEFLILAITKVHRSRLLGAMDIYTKVIAI